MRDIIETAQADPTMTTAGLLERFRNHAEGRHLGKLAAVEIPDIEDFDAGAELADCLLRLAQASERARVENLIEKQRVKKLSDDEKGELRDLGRDSANHG